jgi:hypothetical protein
MAEAPSVIPDPLAFAPDGSAPLEDVADAVAVARTMPEVEVVAGVDALRPRPTRR